MNGFVTMRLQKLLERSKMVLFEEANANFNKKVLFISPHYDDDVISCFGAMKVHEKAKNEMHILYVTDGSASLESGMEKEKLKMVRMKEAEMAIKFFFDNVKFFFMMRKDGNFKVTSEDVDFFSALLLKEKYDYIYCPYVSDTHEDHKESYKLLKMGIEKSQYHCLVRFYEFWYPLSNPNLYIDLKQYEIEKTESIKCHKTQMKFLDYASIANFINQYRGNQIGIESAEVFKEIKSEELMNNKMRLSIVIPAYNNMEYVNTMLTALSRQKCSFSNWEILLIDDSDDERMLFFNERNISNLHIIEKKHSGRADSRNVGIRESKGDIIVFMDSDMIVDYDFVQLHYDAHQNNNCDIVLGRVKHILYEDLEKVREAVEKDIIYKIKGLTVFENYLDLTKIVFQNKKVAEYIGWICCLFSNCSVKREVLEHVGKFNNDFVGWGLEDIELGYRFFLNGYKFGFFDNIKNYHVDHPTNGDKMLVEMGRNLKRLYKIHPDANIRSYMSFVAGFKSLQELVNDISKEYLDVPNGKEFYFKPLKYVKSKG